jgi:hypothetical protein
VAPDLVHLAPHLSEDLWLCPCHSPWIHCRDNTFDLPGVSQPYMIWGCIWNGFWEYICATNRVCVCHVAGRHMIAQGTDGLSRGVLNECIMAGQPMTSFIPLHLNACNCSSDLLAWIHTWIPAQGLQPLTPDEWYLHSQGLDGFTHNTDEVLVPQEVLVIWLLWVHHQQQPPW